MRRARYTQRNSIPPSIEAGQAIPLIKQQIHRLEEIVQLRHNDPKVSAWESTAKNLLDAVYGQPNGEMHRNTYEIVHATSGEPEYVGMTDAEIQRHFVLEQQKRKALLEAYVEQLEQLSLPPARPAERLHRLHSEIERVSWKLYTEGNFKHAAFEAYIRVINAVKEKSTLPLDGDPLMNRAFGCDQQTPVIQFNTLRTAEEKDEQRGFMHLYKGLVGLRNSKAHTNRLFHDPDRGYEYLAFASLLMRLLEIAVVNPVDSEGRV